MNNRTTTIESNPLRTSETVLKSGFVQCVFVTLGAVLLIKTLYMKILERDEQDAESTSPSTASYTLLLPCPRRYI